MYAKSLLCAVLLASVTPALGQGSAEYGKEEFEAKCSKCHSADPVAGPGTGPNLHGVFGTVAGTKPGFVFSDALKASGLVLNDENLAKFIADPNTTAPGNKMGGSYMGTTPEIAADIVAYLKSLPATAPAP